MKAFIKHREISEVCHFTTNRGLVGMLAEGKLLSRRGLPKKSYLMNVAFPNAKYRPEDSAQFNKDKDWLDYVNLSISEINAYFFNVSKRWHKDADVWWAICAFDAEIITHNGVYFATTNNKYGGCIRSDGVEGLEALFAPLIRREPTWVVSRRDRSNSLPTCQQAEVLYPGHVEMSHLRRVYVETDEHSDTVRGWLREFGFKGVEVQVSPEKFLGRPN